MDKTQAEIEAEDREALRAYHDFQREIDAMIDTEEGETVGEMVGE